MPLTIFTRPATPNMTKFVFCFILVAGRVLRVALCIKLDINELVEGTINQTKHDSVPRRLFYHMGREEGQKMQVV